METKFIPGAITYTGEQLRGHHIYKEYGLQGDAVVSFIGAARVEEELVDWVDRRAGAFIYSPRMVHFLVEHFGITLHEGVWRLRSLITLIMEEVCRQNPKASLRRSGNDLFASKRKLSVAIATSSLTSVVMHVGVNILTKGTPVPAIGLKELRISPLSFAKKIMRLYSAEVGKVHYETTKVRGVGEA